MLSHDEYLVSIRQRNIKCNSINNSGGKAGSFQDLYLISTLKVMAKVRKHNEKKLQKDVRKTT